MPADDLLTGIVRGTNQEMVRGVTLRIVSGALIAVGQLISFTDWMLQHYGPAIAEATTHETSEGLILNALNTPDTPGAAAPVPNPPQAEGYLHLEVDGAVWRIAIEDITAWAVQSGQGPSEPKAAQ